MSIYYMCPVCSTAKDNKQHGLSDIKESVNEDGRDCSLMGACYSKSAHEQTNTPKIKKPHGSKKQKNGPAVIVDCSQNGQREDKLSPVGGDGGEKADKEEGGEISASQKAVLDGEDQQDATGDKSLTSEGVDDTDDVFIYVEEDSKCRKTLTEDDKDDTKHGASAGEEVTSQTITPNGCPSRENLCVKPKGAVTDAKSSNPESFVASSVKNGMDTDKSPMHEHDSVLNDPKCACCRLSTHGEFPAFLTNSMQSKRNSEIISLKPSLKKPGLRSDRHCRLSWKSVDSLDWTKNLFNGLDRSQSETSDLFYDELSIHAPLADFDSLDCLGSTSALYSNVRTNFVDYNSDTFQFQFDFSGLDSVVSVSDSTPPVSPVHKPAGYLRQHSLNQQLTNNDNEGSKRSSRELRAFDSTTSLELTSAFQSLQDVKTMQLDGKEVVVIDRDVYVQIMEELSMLKQKLSLLTDIINEQEILVADTSKDRSSVSQD